MDTASPATSNAFSAGSNTGPWFKERVRSKRPQDTLHKVCRATLSSANPLGLLIAFIATRLPTSPLIIWVPFFLLLSPRPATSKNKKALLGNLDQDDGSLTNQCPIHRRVQAVQGTGSCVGGSPTPKAEPRTVNPES